MTVTLKRSTFSKSGGVIIGKGDPMFTPTPEKLRQWRELTHEPEWKVAQRRKDRAFDW